MGTNGPLLGGVCERGPGLPELEYDLLDLLVDGASSFAALFTSLRRRRAAAGVEPARLLEVLWGLEARGLLRVRRRDVQGGVREAGPEDRARALEAYEAWLPRASAAEVGVDTVGLWFELTEEGRAAWALWSGSELDPRERWVLEDRSREGVVEIRAGWREVAESVLKRWLALHGDVEVLPGSITVTRLDPADGAAGRARPRIREGVLLRCRYRRGGRKGR